VGWIRAPEPVIAQLGRLKAVLDLGSSLPSEVIATRLLPEIDSLKLERRKLLSERLALITDLLAEFLPTWRWEPPHGGLCLWVRLPHGNATEFAQTAQRHGVSIVPGSVASVDGSYADYLRLPFGHEPETLREAIRRLSQAWQAYAPVRTSRGEAVAVVV
jgi:DNA-binding transcriptional MocR family regulator